MFISFRYFWNKFFDIKKLEKTQLAKGPNDLW